jgi:hypothetical protein
MGFLAKIEKSNFAIFLRIFICGETFFSRTPVQALEKTFFHKLKV